uniref:BTB_2 domain-containing protein n=1 Tax=Macrostomum lignano TaxID=282301 RepID=A0A1I8FJR2_9PLAT
AKRMAAESVEGDRTRVVINISGSRFETSYGACWRDSPAPACPCLATLRQDDEASFEFWGMYEQDIEPLLLDPPSYSQAASARRHLLRIDNTFLDWQGLAQKQSWEAETNGWNKISPESLAILEDPSTSMGSP